MKTFAELGLSEPLLRAVGDLGFVNPMPVQEEVIPVLMAGETDLIALAQTGTGKTAAFGLPLIERLDAGLNRPQLLVLCPTRELCVQISDDLNEYAKYVEGFHLLPVYGGASIQNQIQNLRRGVSVIVATPGRLLDLMERGEVDLSLTANVVLDEADEMLNMGFAEDIDKVLASVPRQRHILLFSATMPDSIAAIIGKYMHSPREIVIGRKNEGAQNVRHVCYMVHSKDKYKTLKRIVDYCPRIYGIVFCRTKTETQEIADALIRDGYSADALHGDLSQAQRDYVMSKFRLRAIQLLVATDVAARGLDVDDLTHVLNYTLPDEPEVYTHRSGRTGRAGKAGVSIAIINLKEKKRIREIERLIGKTFEEGRIPTGREICSKQIFSLIDNLEKTTVDESQIAEILPGVFRKLDWLDKEELIKRLVTMEFTRLLGYYRDNDDFTAVEDYEKNRRVEVTLTAGFTKLFVNLGRMDGTTPKSLLHLLNDCLKTKVDVGRIDIFTRYSLVDVAEPIAADAIRELSTLKLKGRAIRADVATEEQISRGAKLKGSGASSRSRSRRGSSFRSGGRKGGRARGEEKER